MIPDTKNTLLVAINANIVNLKTLMEESDCIYEQEMLFKIEIKCSSENNLSSEKANEIRNIKEIEDLFRNFFIKKVDYN